MKFNPSRREHNLYFTYIHVYAIIAHIYSGKQQHILHEMETEYIFKNIASNVKRKKL